jgi:hypothetical protein
LSLTSERSPLPELEDDSDADPDEFEEDSDDDLDAPDESDDDDSDSEDSALGVSLHTGVPKNSEVNSRSRGCVFLTLEVVAVSGIL